jgi:hypothetical protein
MVTWSHIPPLKVSVRCTPYSYVPGARHWATMQSRCVGSIIWRCMAQYVPATCLRHILVYAAGLANCLSLDTPAATLRGVFKSWRYRVNPHSWIPDLEACSFPTTMLTVASRGDAAGPDTNMARLRSMLSHQSEEKRSFESTCHHALESGSITP